MKRKDSIQFDWDETAGIATCTMIDSYGRKHIGTSMCNKKDEDMKNEKTGCTIAQRRAEIKALKSYKQDELKPRLRALNQLYYSMNRSKSFNIYSYENSILHSQIRQIEKELNNVNNTIAELTEDLKIYIAEKDKFYKMIRSNREKLEKFKKETLGEED